MSKISLRNKKNFKHFAFVSVDRYAFNERRLYFLVVYIYFLTGSKATCIFFSTWQLNYLYVVKVIFARI